MFRDTVRLLTLILLALVGSRVDAAEQEGWLVSLEKAKAAAASEKKDILMEFTGSDWCPPCIRLKEEVLDTEVFKTEAPKDFVLLKLDSPQDRSKQSPEEIKEVSELSEKFQITGVPTILLADEQGRPFAMMDGYDGTMTAEDYVQALSKKRKGRTERDELFAKANKASGIEKAKLLDQAISMVSGDVALSYTDAVDEILELDTEDQAGLKSKYSELRLKVDLRVALRKIQQDFKREKPDATLKQLDDLIAKFKLKGEALQEPLMAKASITFQVMKDREGAKVILMQAQKEAPESELGQQIGQILKQVFSDDAKDSEKDTESDATEDSDKSE